MFEDFSNISTSYIPNMFQPKYPTLQKEEKIQSVNPNKPYEVIGRDGVLKGYFWYYGNSVDLIFNVSGEITLEDYDMYLSINQILNSLEINATIYNLRHEPAIYFSNGLDAEYPLKVNSSLVNEETGEVSTQIVIPITKEISSLKLPRGTYYLDLTVSHPSGYCETLFDVDACTFEVR